MSYTNNSLSIAAGTGITVTPVTATGATTITISSTGTQTLAIRNALATPITVLTTDEVVSVQVPVAVAVAVTLPVGTTGRTFTIKDGLGLAAPATPITVSPTAGTIDGAVSAIIDAPYGSLTFVYNGTQWLIL